MTAPPPCREVTLREEPKLIQQGQVEHHSPCCASHDCAREPWTAGVLSDSSAPQAGRGLVGPGGSLSLGYHSNPVPARHPPFYSPGTE